MKIGICHLYLNQIPEKAIEYIKRVSDKNAKKTNFKTGRFNYKNEVLQQTTSTVDVEYYEPFDDKLCKIIFFLPTSCDTTSSSFFMTLICEVLVFQNQNRFLIGRFVGYIEIDSGHFFGTAFSKIVEPHFKRNSLENFRVRFAV